MVINYRTEPRFTTEELQEYVDTIAYETVNQRRVVYERRSAKEIQSNSFTYKLSSLPYLFKPKRVLWIKNIHIYKYRHFKMQTELIRNILNVNTVNPERLEQEKRGRRTFSGRRD